MAIRLPAADMKTSLTIFPFDLFGSAGAGAGAALLADEFREILADNRRETTPTCACAYTEHVRLREFTFDTVESYADWRKKGRAGRSPGAAGRRLPPLGRRQSPRRPTGIR